MFKKGKERWLRDGIERKMKRGREIEKNTQETRRN